MSIIVWDIIVIKQVCKISSQYIKMKFVIDFGSPPGTETV